MRWTIPCLLLLGAACTPSLAQGDRAFAEARWAAAEAAWDVAPEEDSAAVLFRRALVRVQPGAPVHDPAAARRMLEDVVQLDPAGPYGAAARLVIDTLRRLDETNARLGALDTELVRCLDNVGAQATVCDATIAWTRTAAAALEEERLRLTTELRTLRDSQAELQQLRDENARLKEELEELKRIDLRE